MVVLLGVQWKRYGTHAASRHAGFGPSALRPRSLWVQLVSNFFVQFFFEGKRLADLMSNFFGGHGVISDGGMGAQYGQKTDRIVKAMERTFPRGA
jgi:hypothetical protein